MTGKENSSEDFFYYEAVFLIVKANIFIFMIVKGHEVVQILTMNAVRVIE